MSGAQIPGPMGGLTGFVIGFGTSILGAFDILPVDAPAKLPAKPVTPAEYLELDRTDGVYKPRREHGKK